MLYDLLLAKSLNGGGGSGGGGLFIATYTNNNDTWECDKTLDEILAAIEAGKSVWAYNSDDDSYMRLDSFTLDEDGKNVLFSSFGMELSGDAVFLWFMTLNHYGSGIDYRYDEANVPTSS